MRKHYPTILNLKNCKYIYKLKGSAERQYMQLLQRSAALMKSLVRAVRVVNVSMPQQPGINAMLTREHRGSSRDKRTLTSVGRTRNSFIGCVAVTRGH